MNSEYLDSTVEVINTAASRSINSTRFRTYDDLENFFFE